MSYTESTMLTLGIEAPPFQLTDTLSGEKFSLEELKSTKATVIMFLCNHCPYVKHVNPEIIRVAKDFIPRGVSFIAISSNDAVRYPDDGPEQMKINALELGYPFPYLYDETQEVARAYDAACTPDFYLFDGELQLVYRGRLDDAKPKNENPLTGKDLRNAIAAVLNGEPVADKQYPSAGCNIKWKIQ
jgi:thiol-disulfide isomerase/thioredoxin